MDATVRHPAPSAAGGQMSPVARRPGAAHTGRTVVIAVVAVSAALAAAFGVATLASRGDVEVRLGDDRFDAGDADARAESVAEGGPILFPDPARFRRAVYVDHRGGDPSTGWVAFGAFVPDDPDCSVGFETESGLYASDCAGSMTFPRSGEGLREYDVEVVDGTLFVDLQDDPPEDP